MINDHEVSISAEGIYVSCSKDLTRLWEFHPDDVTSVSIYREDGQIHELIATLNRNFDVSEAASGLKELNERLSRELNAKITVDAECSLCESGVVLWPGHLAGSPLWQFYVLGEDGLTRYVSPGTPNALRNTSRAISREMARFAKPRLERFPTNLIDRGFIYHGDIGWYKDDAVLVAEWLHGKSAAIVDAELWLVKNSFVQPHIQTAAGLVACHYWTTTAPDESWQAFANRSLNDATAFIRQFQWPNNTIEVGEPEVRFCLSWVWREWLEEDKFRFPK